MSRSKLIEAIETTGFRIHVSRSKLIDAIETTGFRIHVSRSRLIVVIWCTGFRWCSYDKNRQLPDKHWQVSFKWPTLLFVLTSSFCNVCFIALRVLNCAIELFWIFFKGIRQSCLNYGCCKKKKKCLYLELHVQPWKYHNQIMWFTNRKFFDLGWIKWKHAITEHWSTSWTLNLPNITIYLTDDVFKQIIELWLPAINWKER